MIHDFEGRATKQPLAENCDSIDKKKFAAWTEETAEKQKSQETADAETSLRNWNLILGGKTAPGKGSE
jgi:hypothetical protein